ncbi:Smr/MutS family protein [Phenylobacterium sp.]|uniref:Smr/MutS family protein n=1 Tax=Phenylobacterium sp. TaxID=1871053 RepID=UPI00391DBF6B
MKRPLKPEEQRIWSLVAATVHPLPGRATPKGPSAQTPAQGLDAPARIDPRTLPPKAPASTREGVDPIEPNRKHRIARERDPIGGRIDLHGMTQDRARAALERFLARSWDDGCRSVLVITGKGVQGDGVLRRAAPEWLAAPHLAHIVAGVSEAHRRHGGAGALYVALKRKPRG